MTAGTRRACLVFLDVLLALAGVFVVVGIMQALAAPAEAGGTQSPAGKESLVQPLTHVPSGGTDGGLLAYRWMEPDGTLAFTDNDDRVPPGVDAKLVVLEGGLGAYARSTRQVVQPRVHAWPAGAPAGIVSRSEVPPADDCVPVIENLRVKRKGADVTEHAWIARCGDRQLWRVHPQRNQGPPVHLEVDG